MSKGSSTSMTFGEFCDKVNSDAAFRQEYLKRPVELVEDHLHIQLSAVKAKELEDTVDELKKRTPFPTLYVPGKAMPLAASTGPQAH